jgi:type III pantothenate kinase
VNLDDEQRNTENVWLALMVGNSRLHWALFINDSLDATWNTEHQPESGIQQIDFPRAILPPSLSSPSPLLLASVVPSQTKIWQTYPHLRVITLDQVPLLNTYPTLGIDRALALWGAGKQWGFPMLVIDAGTALTFTGADANRSLVGGAILPGLGLQFATLNQKTGQLPQVETRLIAPLLPPRFALNTSQAIESGVIYTLVAGIKDFIVEWWRLFPESNITITGGDRLLLVNYLEAQFPAIAKRLYVEPNLIFWGMQKIMMGNN